MSPRPLYTVNLRLDDKLKADLDALQEYHRLSASDILRLALAEKARRDGVSTDPPRRPAAPSEAEREPAGGVLIATSGVAVGARSPVTNP